MANRGIPAGQTDYAVPPGDTLKENLDYLNMSQKELADRMGMAQKTINEIIKGKAPITPETATKLESVLGVEASFWLAMEANYRADMARLENREQIEKECPIAAGFPYSEMSNNGWIPSTRKREEKVEHLRRFFRVASLENVPDLPFAANFRRKETQNTSFYALMAWLRQGERIAEDIRTEPFSADALRRSIPELRSLSSCPQGFDEKVTSICAACGVAVTFVPHIKGTSVNGATRWISPTRALVSVSLRHRYADVFWFSFFHELGHILKGHGKKGTFISTDEECPVETQEREREADDFARDTLIPPDRFDTFVKENTFTDGAVLSFSDTIGIHPGIVWGRLAKEGHVNWNRIPRRRLSLQFA